MFCFCFYFVLFLFLLQRKQVLFSFYEKPQRSFKEGEKLSSNRAKMPKEKKVKGRKWPWPSASRRSGKPKGSESSLRKGLRTSALDRTSSSKETSLAQSDGRATQAASQRAILYKYLKVPPAINHPGPGPAISYPAI